MRILAGNEIEIDGENGARIFASCDASGAPLSLRLVDYGTESVVVELDPEEAVQLADLISRSPRDKGKPSASLMFAGDGGSISFRQDVMGEPFRTGVSVTVEASWGPCRHVFAEQREISRLGSFIDELPMAAAAVSGPR